MTFREEDQNNHAVGTLPESVDSFSVSIPDIQLDETSTIQIEAPDAEQITVDTLWTDWLVTAVTPENAVENINPPATPTDGTVVFTWDSPQDVTPTVGVEPNANTDPAPKYVGGEYQLTVQRNGGDEERTGTFTITDITTVHQGTFAVDQYNTAYVDANHIPRSEDRIVHDWEYDIGSDPDDLIKTAPALTDDTVVFGANNNNVYALDVTDGSERWVTDVGTDVRGSPAIADGTVYVGAGPSTEHPDGHLYALDIETGEIEWDFEPNNVGAGKPEAVWAAPTVIDDTVYVGPKTGYMTALDAADGSLLWEEYMYGWIEAAPAITANTVYVPVGSGEGAVVALAREDGAEQWRYQVSGAYSQVDAAPTVHRNRVIVGATVWPEDEDSWPELFCLDAESGDPEWRVEFSGGFDHTVAVREDTVYVLSDALYALNLADGSERWKADTSGGSAPLVVGDVVLTGSDPTAAVDAETGEILWTVDSGGGNHVAVGPDRIYVPDFRGRFTAYAIQ